MRICSESFGIAHHIPNATNRSIPPIAFERRASLDLGKVRRGSSNDDPSNGFLSKCSLHQRLIIASR